MSSFINDENNDTCNEFLQRSTHNNNNRLDSGYLTFNSPCQSSSSYLISPTRLSPSIVIYNRFDSPTFESDLQSPINPIKKKFVSTMDYENYITTRKYFDILTQLFHRNTYHLIDEILKHLSKTDFYQCSTVCKTWNWILKDHSKRLNMKNIKRNLFDEHNQTRKSSTKNHKFTSTPMKIRMNKVEIDSNEITSNEESRISAIQTSTLSNEDNISLTASTMTFRYGYLKYLHGPTIPKRCPICGFVSVVDVNDQHGICTNPLCRNSFCQYCSGPYHPSSPCKTTIGPVKSPWRKRPKISPIYSNKTRNNLRRLLLN